ncbi:MAG: stage II sporulation protein R [Ruminococcaceae bacterium]|nr:stage II sporulation protein R [Oscillospiraceae bacterium]
MNINEKKKYIDLKNLLRSVSIAVVFLLVLSVVGFGANYDNIRENVLRLHILANSDTAEDQALKLKVRDAVLQLSEEIFIGCSSEQQASTAARDNLKALEAVALKTVSDNGYSYPVTATVCNMWFEDRVYDDFTLPAGMYEAVRIEIGEAKGKNWWCVMFPSVCLPSASDKGLDATLNKKETEMCESPDRYVVKFKVVELFHRCRKEIKSWF